jgi:hypothetical protein
LRSTSYFKEKGLSKDNRYLQTREISEKEDKVLKIYSIGRKATISRAVEQLTIVRFQCKEVTMILRLR